MQVSAQVVERNVFSVFAPADDNDTLLVAGGQIMTRYDSENYIEHGYYPLNNTLLSIDKLNVTTNFLVYPNPFSESFYVQVDQLQDEDIEINVFSATGKNVYSGTFNGNSHLIETQALSAGVYYMIARTDKTVLFREKLIKR